MKFKSLKPDKAFSEKAKARFLAAFDAQYGTRPQTRAASSRFALTFKYGLVAVLVLIGTVAGASVYADSANVPADSAFYSLKRLNEAVQLAVTPAAAKPELQATLAVRRGNEITDLETRKPSSTILLKLNSDLDSDVNTSVNGIVKQIQKGGASVDLCGSLLASIAGASSSAHIDLLSHPQVIKRFEDRCRVVQARDGGDSAATTTTVTTNVNATTSATSTFQGGHFPRFNDNGKNGGNDEKGNGADTKDATHTRPTSSTSIFPGIHPPFNFHGDDGADVSVSGTVSTTASATLDLDL